MKRFFLGAALLLGGIGASTNNLNFQDGIVSTQVAEKTVKEDIINNISFVGLVKVKDPKTDKELSFGSCFPVSVVRRDGQNEVYFLTCKHVIRDPKKFIYSIEIHRGPKYKIGFQSSIIFREVKVVAFNEIDDIAILKARANEYFSRFKLDDKPPKALTEIYAAGFPLGFNLYVTKGLAIGPWNFKNSLNWKSSAPIYSGNSGGPIIDVKTGKVIGIARYILKTGDFALDTITHATMFTPVYKHLDWLNKYIPKI